ncbi:hypothetical protein [Curtobacterium sp. MCBA15_001]|uniref:hypothetical protein n=1 Tax=Curtobacterium sp. MCBA15_001 TaxID=1898731 RepID=UPI001113CEAD|nr:hypothetical protein [Curtobacterium sp. MCBA15_001]
MTTRRPARAISVAAFAVPVALLLAGCSGGGGGAGPSSTPSATAGVVGQRVAQTCAELVPQSTFSVYGEQFTLDTSAEPSRGSAAARIAQQRGRVCVFAAAGKPSETITLAVAHLPEKSLTDLKDALFEQGGSVPTYTVEGYFALHDNTGRADAFADPYWITTSSTLFTEPGTAQPVVDAARAALGPSASATPAG